MRDHAGFQPTMVEQAEAEAYGLPATHQPTLLEQAEAEAYGGKPQVDTYMFKLDPEKQGLPPVPSGYLYVKRGDPSSAVYVPGAQDGDISGREGEEE